MVHRMFAEMSVAMTGLVGEVFVHLNNSIMPRLSRNAMPEPLQKDSQTLASETSINMTIDPEQHNEWTISNQ